MTRLLALALAALPLAGCRAVHVVAELAASEGQGASDSSEGTGPEDPTAAATTDTTDTSAGTRADASESGGACEPAPPCEGEGDPFRAIGLGCPETPLAGAPTLTSSDPRAVRVLRQFGNATWVAREGASFLALSTGVLPFPDANGNVTRPPGAARAAEGANDNPDFQDLPAPLVAAPGAAGAPYQDCDGVGDCSNSLPGAWQVQSAQDLVWFDLAALAPEGARSYRLEVALLSAEYPDRSDNPLVDLFVLWIVSEGFTGNLAAWQGEVFGAHGLRDPILAGGLVGEAPGLVGTGFDGLREHACDFGWAAYPKCPNGGAAGWFTLTGPAGPGESVRVTAALFDQWDALADTTVLLDAWRWRCEACVLGVDCGAAPSP